MSLFRLCMVLSKQGHPWTIPGPHLRQILTFCIFPAHQMSYCRPLNLDNAQKDASRVCKRASGYRHVRLSSKSVCISNKLEGRINKLLYKSRRLQTLTYPPPHVCTQASSIAYESYVMTVSRPMIWGCDDDGKLLYIDTLILCAARSHLSKWKDRDFSL